MATTGIWVTGVNEETKAKIEHIAKERETNMSTLIRPMLRKIVEENKEYLENYQSKKTV